jgi:hypothetical protein
MHGARPSQADATAPARATGAIPKAGRSATFRHTRGAAAAFLAASIAFRDAGRIGAVAHPRARRSLPLFDHGALRAAGPWAKLYVQNTKKRVKHHAP